VSPDAPHFLVVWAVVGWAGNDDLNQLPQTRAGPRADKAVAGGFQRSQVATGQEPGGISLNSAKYRLVEPKTPGTICTIKAVGGVRVW
jgi:hypothetical protein